MNELRNKAKRLRDAKKYDEALKVYKILVDDIQFDNMDKWLGWEYADTLKKCNRLDESILICKNIYQHNKDFNYIKFLYSWCLYEKYFKNLDINNKVNINDAIHICKIGNFIINIIDQNSNTPYEKTIYKIIKLLENINFSNKDEKILKWIEKLDLDKISRDVYVFECNGKRLEKASMYEISGL